MSYILPPVATLRTMCQAWQDVACEVGCPVLTGVNVREAEPESMPQSLDMWNEVGENIQTFPTVGYIIILLSQGWH